MIGHFKERDANAENAVPGLHAFDDSYTEMTVQWADMEIYVESAVDGDDLLLLVTPVKQQVRPAMMVVETGYLWKRPGYTVKQGVVIEAKCGEETRIIRCTGTEMFDPNIPVQNACLMIVMDSPIGVYTGKQRTLEQIQQKIAEARARVLRESEKYGEYAGMYQAMECALA